MHETSVDSGAKLRVWGFELGPFATNCYVVAPPEGASSGNPCWIIDAGFQPEALIEAVRQEGLTPKKIVLTHAHMDHIAGIDEVRRAFPDAPTVIHEAEASWLSDPSKNLSASFGLPFTTRDAEATVSGGETLELDGLTFDVLHTPGHSPGGITLYHAASGNAFVGDTLFKGSIGRFDFPTSDQGLLFASISETLYGLPDETVAWPGHGPRTTIGGEKRSNPYVRG